MVNLKLLFVIIDDGNDKKIKYLLNKYNIRVKTVTNASGTASQSVLDYFGLSKTEKEVFMAIVPDYLSETILEKINIQFNMHKVGTGIAFTIPISSSNKFLSDSFKKESGSELNMNMKNEIENHLIITIASEGYLEQIMTSAKRAGCGGGTSIKGRSLSNANKAKILGFNIEPEKDIVLNIVSTENKTKVMEEITKEVGIKTKGKSICLSLPIDSIVGLDIK